MSSVAQMLTISKAGDWLRTQNLVYTAVAIAIALSWWQLGNWLFLSPTGVAGIFGRRRDPRYSVSPHTVTELFPGGWETAMRLRNVSYNGTNPLARNFVPMPRSLNTHGGAQFSYSFWLKIEDVTNPGLKDLPLLLRGDARRYQAGMYDPSSKKRVHTLPPGHLIRCPVVRLGSSPRELVVELNTGKYIDVRLTTGAQSLGGSQLGILGLAGSDWFMVTLACRDNYSPMDGAENGVHVAFYVNDLLLMSASPSTDARLRHNYLKQNDGDLVLFPDAPSTLADSIAMGDVKYRNFAVSAEDVRSEFKKGPPHRRARDEELHHRGDDGGSWRSDRSSAIQPSASALMAAAYGA